MYRKQKWQKGSNEDEKDQRDAAWTKAWKMTQRTQHLNSRKESKNKRIK